MSFVSAESASADNGATINVFQPSGAAEDDIAIAAIMVSDADTADSALPDDFTQLHLLAVGGTDGHIRVGYKVLTSSEPPNYTFSANAIESRSAAVAVFRGYSVSSPIDDSDTNTGDSTTPTTPSITTTGAEGMVIAIAGFASGAGSPFTPPSGMTEAADTASPSSLGTSLSLAYVEQATAGATGTKQFTASDDDTWGGITIALKSATVDITRTLSDSISTADDTESARHAVRDILESLESEDRTSSALSISLSDLVNTEDARSITRDALRRMSDEVDIDDAARATDYAVRLLSDAVAISDELARQAIIRLRKQDSLEVDDQATTADALVRVMSDLVSLADIATSQLFARLILRTLEESLDLEDSVSASRDLMRPLKDALLLSDERFREVYSEILLSEEIDTGDEVDRFRLIPRRLADAVDALDVIEAARFLLLRETLGVEDSAVTGVGVFRYMAELLEITDTSTSEIQTIHRILSDAIQIEEQLRFNLLAVLSETVDIDDAESASRTLQRAIQESVTISDEETIALLVGRVFADSVSVEDDVTEIQRSISRFILDAIETTDNSVYTRFIESIKGLHVLSAMRKEPVDSGVETESIVTEITKFS